MKIYDATLPIEEGMIAFPGDPPFRMMPLSDMRDGGLFSLSLLSMGTHTGTHIDSPKHYLEGGAGVEALPLDVLVGPGVVLDLRGRPSIDEEALAQSSIGHHKRVLLKTDSGPHLVGGFFREDYVHLTEGGARYLVHLGVSLVGIDSLSVECYQNMGGPVHRLLLGAGMVIVEGAQLLEVPPGPYEILCLPLRIQGADGSPARLILRSS